MSELPLDLVLLVSGLLVVLAGWVAAYRPDARSVGIAGGLALMTIGVALLQLRPDGFVLGPVAIDAVSLPRLTLCGLALAAVFSVMPRRHATGGGTAALVLLAVGHLLLAMAPEGILSGVLWAVCAGLTGLALPAGPARRMALPYLALSAGLGLAGTVLAGNAGSALMWVAVAVRLGVFPFHSWVVAAYQLAPTTVAVALVAPMSALGLIARTPLGYADVGGIAPTVGLAVAALLTGGLAIVQKELGRAVGFLTVSVSTVVLLGVLDTDAIGHIGGLVMWTLTAVSLVGLGLVTGALRSRLGSVPVDRHSGLIAKTPVLGTLFLLFGLAAVGAPGTADFASEDLVLHGAMAHHAPLLVLFIAAVSLQAYAVFHLFYRLFFGPEVALAVADALPREKWSLAALAALLVVAGLAPQLVMNKWLTPGTAAQVAAPTAVHAAVVP